MLDGMMGLGNPVRLLALSCYDRHVLRDFPCCAGLIALCCAVLAVDGRRLVGHKTC